MIDTTTNKGFRARPTSRFYDLITVGGGPSALTAAIYAAREGIQTLVVERAGLGGHVGLTHRVENYPGFPGGIAGSELVERFVEQCRLYGAEFLTGIEASSIGVAGEERIVRLEGFSGSEEIRSRALLLAPGSTHRRLGVKGEDNLIGFGIHFCTTCDGPFYRGKDIMVVGGGNSAVEGALFLTSFARKVTIVHRGAELVASKMPRDAALNHPQIEILLNTTVEEFKGDSQLSAVVLRNVVTGEIRETQPAGVFVYIGTAPNTNWLKGTVALDKNGFILTDNDLQTSVSGVFAAGDARSGSIKQLISAAGEGAAAALMIRQYLERAKVVPTSTAA